MAARRVPRPPRAGAYALASVAVAGAAFAASLAFWLSGGGTLDVDWAPTLGLRIDLAFDGLGALYALLATGIGLAVFAYGSAYLPRYLRGRERPATEARRFWPWMVLFMGAMVGLACARDLILLFVFFDLTAVASYFLIAFDKDEREARGAALMALLVTGVSAVALLVGAVLLYGEHGTFSLEQLVARAGEDTTTTTACALIAVAALAKSAQVPFHFWLPRAMAAPTPVSAYLHSAAMVAAGVLVLGRVHPLLAKSDLVLDALVVLGAASIAVGGVLALAQNGLKQVLAYSTISQYGYVVVLYGLGGATAAGAAAFYVLAHALAKSALFMTAGAVADATGRSRLDEVGGLARGMPVLAVASGAAVATLAALPLTVGFFKDELFFAAAHEAGGGMQVVAVLAAALTFAYLGRFWLGLFTGPVLVPPRRPPVLLIAPIAVLAGLAVAGGLVVRPFARLAEEAGTVTHGAPVTVDPAYHLDLGAENVMALCAWALGLLVLAAPRTRTTVARAAAAAGRAVGPRRWYATCLEGLNDLSERLHRLEVRDLRMSLAAVLVPTGVLAAAAFAVTPTDDAYDVGSVDGRDLPLIVLLALVVAAALTVARDPGRFVAALALSVMGFGLGAVYAVMGAPDVALVAVVVETVVTLVFVAVLSRLPPSATSRARRRRAPVRWRSAGAGVVAGAASFIAIWAALSRPTVTEGVSGEHIRRTPDAHGGDAVTVTLADFRGFDTLVEITVLAVAVVGAISLLRRGRAG